MKVAIYARVSTNKQDNGNQLVELWEFAAKQNWQIVTEYVDTVSGSGKKERAQFEGMMLPGSYRAASRPPIHPRMSNICEHRIMSW